MPRVARRPAPVRAGHRGAGRARRPPPRHVPLVRPDQRVRQDERVTPVRAVAGAAVSLTGVLLLVGALLLLTDPPPPDPAVSALRERVERPLPLLPGDGQVARRTPGQGVPGQGVPGKGVPRQGVTREQAGARAGAGARPAPSGATASSAAPSRSGATRPAGRAPAPAAPAPAVSPTRPPVDVLNNSRRSGLADRAADRVRSAGWRVQAVGNLRGAVPATTVYFAPGQRASAELLGHALGVRRVLARPAGLPGRAPVTLVVAREFPG